MPDWIQILTTPEELPRRAIRAVDVRLRPRLRALEAWGWLGRTFRPVLDWRGRVHVFRFDDVRSVLSRPDEFGVATFGERMQETIGPFFLGMDDSTQYRVESGAFRDALDLSDARLTDVQRAVSGLAANGVERALKLRGEVDVVRDLADEVPLAFASAFFGIPEPQHDGETLVGLFRAASSYVFGVDMESRRPAAREAGAKIAAHLRSVVAERSAQLDAGRPARSDVLGRMLAASRTNPAITEDVIARCLAGSFSGTVIPTSWLFIEAVDRLLRLPSARRAQLGAHAQAGDTSKVRAFVLEAARFFPFPPVILRRARCDAWIGGRRVEAGTDIILEMSSAAVDPRSVPQAARFRPGRPEGERMLFGHDRHACMGQPIGEALLTAMAVALFSQRGLRRASGSRGFLQYEPRDATANGPYPKSLVLVADD
jgi:cytochrome P450